MPRERLRLMMLVGGGPSSRNCMFSSLWPSCRPRFNSQQQTSTSSSLTGQLGTPSIALLPKTLLPKRVPMLMLLFICPNTWKFDPSLMFSPAPAISQRRLEENTGFCSRCSTASDFISLVGCYRANSPSLSLSAFSTFSVLTCFSSRFSRLSLSFFSGLQAGEIWRMASTSWLKSGSWWRMRRQRSWQTLLRVLGLMRLVRCEFFFAQFSKMALKPGQIRQVSSIKSSLFSLRKNLRLQVTSMRQRMRCLYSGWSLAMLTTSRTSSEFCVMRRSRMSQLVSRIMQAKKMLSIQLRRKILATALMTLQTGNLSAMVQLRATDRRMGITQRISLLEQLLQAMLQREGTQPPSWSTDILFYQSILCKPPSFPPFNNWIFSNPIERQKYGILEGWSPMGCPFHNRKKRCRKWDGSGKKQRIWGKGLLQFKLSQRIIDPFLQFGLRTVK